MLEYPNKLMDPASASQVDPFSSLVLSPELPVDNLGRYIIPFEPDPGAGMPYLELAGDWSHFMTAKKGGDVAEPAKYAEGFLQQIEGRDTPVPRNADLLTLGGDMGKEFIEWLNQMDGLAINESEECELGLDGQDLADPPQELFGDYNFLLDFERNEVGVGAVGGQQSNAAIGAEGGEHMFGYEDYGGYMAGYNHNISLGGPSSVAGGSMAGVPFLGAGCSPQGNYSQQNCGRKADLPRNSSKKGKIQSAIRLPKRGMFRSEVPLYLMDPNTCKPELKKRVEKAIKCKKFQDERKQRATDAKNKFLYWYPHYERLNNEVEKLLARYHQLYRCNPPDYIMKPANQLKETMRLIRYTKDKFKL